MRDRRDPEHAWNTEIAKLLLDRNWCDGLIGDAAYLRSLMNLGYGDKDAHTELSLLNMAGAERRVPQADEARMTASREWLRRRA